LFIFEPRQATTPRKNFRNVTKLLML
jgi:hypothetical protein